MTSFEEPAATKGKGSRTFDNSTDDNPEDSAIDNCDRQQEELWNILFQVKKIPHSTDIDIDTSLPSVTGVCTKKLLAYCEKYGGEWATGSGDCGSRRDSSVAAALQLERFGPSGFKPLHYLCSVVRTGSSICIVVAVTLQIVVFVSLSRSFSSGRT